MRRAKPVDEKPACGDRQPLGRHDRQVVALGEPHGLEQGEEAFLLDEQDRAVAMAGTAGREDRHLRQVHLQLR
jgi:hypothetical protein